MKPLPEKYVETLRPVLPKTAKMLEESSNGFLHAKELFGSNKDCSLSIGSKQYERMKGKWYSLKKVPNPEYNPNTPIIVVVSDADTGKIRIVRMPLEIKDFHKKMMKFFKAMNIKYRWSWQVEMTLDIDFDKTEFPKFEMKADGSFKKIPTKVSNE